MLLITKQFYFEGEENGYDLTKIYLTYGCYSPNQTIQSRLFLCFAS